MTDNPHPKPARSQPARDRILQAAKLLFAAHGFENTTIRSIGKAADVHASMVMRYYGTKEDLFATVADIDFRVPDLTAVPAETRGTVLVAHILERWEGPENQELQAILRAAGTHPIARRRLVELIETQAVPVIRGALLGERTEERLGLIIIEIAGLVLSRHFLHHPAVLSLDRATIVRRVGGTIQNYLDG